MKKPKKMILTAGPSISQKEVRYVTDAVKNGWNFHYRDYIDTFEKYIGVKYALALSSGTAALHVACLGCELGPGDEVLIPEITFVASANAVVYTGATPIFVDVEPDTWCMDPQVIRRAITKKTKAIMPVHIYGHPANMIAINTIAKEYGLKVIEDACPSIGATVKGKKVGGLSDVGAFSFQGAKAMVTGEGGMLVTDSAKIYERAQYYGNHAKDHAKAFWHTDVGYMYRMTNMQAALGLAQLERVGEFIVKKRKIFSWYNARLRGVKCIRLNYEAPWAKSLYWMSSVVLEKNAPIRRDALMVELKKRMIDTRQFFYPVSMFPMYTKKHYAKLNPIAYWVGTHGINLPSGVMLTEKTVDYVARSLIDILQG
jgi:perosamine synthetase